MLPTSVAVLVDSKRITVPPQPFADVPVVPATHLVVEIEDRVPLPREILINDEPFPIIRDPEGTRGHVLIDRTRSTGYHRFRHGGATYCFGTADAKLQLDGIVRILEVIRSEGLSWGHQLICSNGAGIRDPRVDFAWLRRVGREVLQVCGMIAENPALRSEATVKVRRHRGGRALVAPTLSKLRAQPSALLEKHHTGIISVGGERFMPRRVVTTAASVTHDTGGNRRATRLLLDVQDLTDHLLAADGLPKRARQWLEAFQASVTRLSSTFPFSSLHWAAARIPDSPAREEQSDPRYVRVVEILDELVWERGWNPISTVADRYAYVAESDAIYQAFVAVVLAEAFETRPVHSFLRGNIEEPSYRSERFEIYYDTAPPKPQFRSWRDRSSRPGRLTPDYVILDLERGRGLLGDAKYRASSGNGKLPGSSLNECQVYMQHFDVPTFAVFYPGRDRFIREVTGDGNIILEVSITPFEGVVDWVRDEVRPRLEAMMHPLG